MSVTFTAEMSAVTSFTVDCGCEDAVGPTFATYQEAEVYLIPLVEDESLRTPLPGCSDPELCLAYRLQIRANEVDAAPSINVNNGNAADLFRALGLLSDEPAVIFDGIGVVSTGDGLENPWSGGDLSPADFLGRVMLAQAISPADEGRPAIETVSAGGMVTIECSRPVGYLQDRLSQLRELAEFAVSRDRGIFWS